jgi:hypothetical protein
MRLEILSRDKFTCQICGDDTNTLAVHHLDYKSGLEPWEYDQSWLLTVCEECHDMESNDRKDFEREMIRALKLKRFHSYQMNCLVRAFEGFNSDRKPCMSDRASCLIGWLLLEPEVFDKLESEYIKLYGEIGWDEGTDNFQNALSVLGKS